MQNIQDECIKIQIQKFDALGGGRLKSASQKYEPIRLERCVFVRSKCESFNGIYEDDNILYSNKEDLKSYANRLIHDFESGKIGKYLSRLEYYQLAQSENNRNHNAVLLERQMIDRVKSGDMDSLKNMYSNAEMNVDFSTIGYVSKDVLKRHEYYSLTSIILNSRAAKEAGVPVETAYGLSDVFMQQISEATTIEEYDKISLLAMVTFTKLVSDIKKNKKYPYIDACKDYIARNLRKPFKISDIGPQIGINNSYLSKKFSETEGMTISQYVTRKRCSHAANLLKYSDYELSDIAEYFCFSSHSHFGAQFKKVYGMTPSEYRQRYKDSGTYSY